MKQCKNPYCECEQGFPDEMQLCPFCGTELSPVEDVEDEKQSQLHTAEELPTLPAAAPSPPLVTKGAFGRKVLRGRLVEMDHNSLFLSGFHKWCNAVFGGEPWQFAHQSQAYTLRIEEITQDGVPGGVLDVCAYGDYLGRFCIGDELEIHCTGGKNRRVAKKILDKTTGSVVRPGLQIPALFIRLFSLITVLLLFYIAAGAVSLVKSGAIVSLLVGAAAALLGLAWKLLAAFGSNILIIIGIVIAVRACLPHRK